MLALLMLPLVGSRKLRQKLGTRLLTVVLLVAGLGGAAAFQVDYLRTQLPNGATNVQNNLRLAAGLVARFGR